MISSIPPQIVGCYPNLQELVIAQNRLNGLFPPTEFIQAFPKIVTLIASNNAISTINVSDGLVESSISILDLSNNAITALPSGLLLEF
jgi:Leucine-rich repeat (LRR) protein